MFSSRKGFWNVNLIKVLEKWFTVAILWQRRWTFTFNSNKSVLQLINSLILPYISEAMWQGKKVKYLILEQFEACLCQRHKWQPMMSYPKVSGLATRSENCKW
jgi:hypothetical protein